MEERLTHGETDARSETAAPYKGAAAKTPASTRGESRNFRRELLNAFRDALPEKEADLRTYSPLALAFLGDAVYAVIARTLVFAKGSMPAEKMHNRSAKLVSAKAQAAVGDALTAPDAGILTEEELDIYRRGRNANPYHTAKNAARTEYLKATALETLCAYLYLTDREERLFEVICAGMRRTELTL